MRRLRARALPWALATMAVTAPVSAQQCPAGLETAGDVGIRALRCQGPAASCAINLAGGDTPRHTGADPNHLRPAVRHVFAVEPVITSVVANSELVVGDTLVAIDDVLITTAAGGTRLARPPVGQMARLLVRRAGALREVRVSVRPGCGITSLTVSR